MSIETISGQTHSLDNLAHTLAYNADRWQSKVLSEKAGVKTILFAFAPEQLLATHMAPVEVLVVALEGHAVFTLDGKDHAFCAGEVIRIPAQVPHAIRALSYFKMLLIK